MLGMFLLPAFTRLGHECPDLLSPCDGIHVCKDWTSVYTLIRKSLGNGVRTHVNSKGKIPSVGSSEEDQTHDDASRGTASPTHYPLSYCGPRFLHLTLHHQNQRSSAMAADKVDGRDVAASRAPPSPLRLSGWMVMHSRHCIFSCLYVCPGGWSCTVVTVSSLASTSVRVDGHAQSSLYLLLPLRLSGWMVNQGGHPMAREDPK